jgi:NAD dependent epimerase/dehydratase family enzyme
MHIRIGLNAPELAIKLGAKLIGTEPELILNSSYIVPKRLVDAGFKFSFPQLSLALDELLN